MSDVNQYKNIYINNGGINEEVELREYFEYGEGKLIIYSVGLQSLFVLNLRTLEIEDFFRIFDKDNKKIYSIVKNGNSIFGVSACNGDVYEYNIQNGLNKRHSIWNTSSLERICSDGKRFWMSGNTPFIYEWKVGQMEASAITAYPPDLWDYGDSRPLAEDSIFLNNKAYFFPSRGNEIIILQGGECVNIKVSNMNFGDRIFKNGSDGVSMLSYIRDKRYIGFYVFLEGKQYELDTTDDSIRELEIKYD